MPGDGGTCRVGAELQLAAPLGAAGGAAGSALAGCLQEPGATVCHPTVTPQNTPAGLSHIMRHLHVPPHPEPTAGKGPQDPAGPGASLTIKAEKPPGFGTLATEKWGSTLKADKKVSLSPLVLKKEMNKCP